MRGSKLEHTCLFFLLTCTIVCYKSGYCSGKDTILCHEIERQALLDIKKSVEEDPSNLLYSWNATEQFDCCMWEGVVCSNLTGHVHELHLQGRLGYNLTYSGKELNPSTLNLKHLRLLDLSHNHFGETISIFIGSFASLVYLDLSYSGFQGIIPRHIGNLSNLRTLNIGYQPLEVDGLDWLSHLSRLEHLDMSYVNLTKATNWLQVINTLPSLITLDFPHCSLGIIGPLDHVNFSSLAVLDLSYNSFQNAIIPSWIFQLQELTFLDVSWCDFNGSIPSTSNITKLQHIDLSRNSFSSVIPNWLYLCNNLEFATMSGNILQGTISESIANLTSLKVLDLSFNQLSGNLPDTFGNLNQLQTIDLSQNKMEGVVTESHFSNLTKLTVLHAPGNHLTLKVRPTWIPPFKLSSLTVGSWSLGSDQIPIWLDTQKEYIQVLDLSGTGLISDRIPSWFWDIDIALDLSHNQLYGNIPDLKNGFPTFTYLSSNRFNGPLPRVGGSWTLDLSNNSFTGGIFQVLCNTTNRYGSQLSFLNLEENKLSGEIPDCLMNWSSLQYLNLGKNKMSGTIPKSIGLLNSLSSLNLNNNSFSGQIPSSLKNCSLLAKIDLSYNEFVGDVPEWLGTSLTNLRFLILHSNKLSGILFPELCQLNSLQILDLSNNNFSGTIPHCFNNFTAMTTKGWVEEKGKRDFGFFEYGFINGIWVGPERYTIDSASVHAKGNVLHYKSTLSLVTNIDLSRNNFSGEIPEELTRLVELRSLDLSQNRLQGSIPEAIGNMAQLESLDFSSNFLSGEIPDSFSTMTSLNYLNLSFNNLTGRIPESTQLQTFPNSSFIGNNLCGLPLTSRCNGDHADIPNQENVDTSNSEVDWFYVFLTSGYATGFSATCITLIFSKTCRYAYFGFLSNTWDKFCAWCKTW